MATATRHARRETPAETARRRTAAKRSEDTSVKENPIYKTLFEEKLSPEKQIDALEKLLAFLDTENKAKMATRSMHEIMEFLALQQKEMHEELIELTDVEVNQHLQSIYQNLNSRRDRWRDLIKPLIEMLKGIYDLRKNNLTGDAWREIHSDRMRKEALDKLRGDIGRQIEKARTEINREQEEIDRLSEDKTLFGLGPVRKASREAIAVKKTALDQQLTGLNDLETKLQKLATDDAAESTLSAEMQEAKEGLRRLLETDREQHKQMQIDVVNETRDFIEAYETETKRGRIHLAEHGKQFDRLKTMNREIGQVMTVLEEATRRAELLSDEQRKKLEVAPEGETSIQKMQREARKRAIEEHMRVLGSVATDVGKSSAELQNEAVTIRTGKETTDNQANALRMMSTTGTAALARQLNATLTAINAASLNESNEMARMAIKDMNDETQSILKQEVIRVANEGAAMSDEIQRMIEEMAELHVVYSDAQELTAGHMEAVRGGIDELKGIREDFAEDVDKAISRQADIGVGEKRSKTKESALADSPFGKE